MRRLHAVGGAALLLAAASVAAWSLAYPQSSVTDVLVRAVADGAAVVTLGMAVLPMLDVDRYRTELIRRGAAPLAAASAVWLLAELTRLIVTAAQTSGLPVARLGMPTTVDFVLHTTAGRAALLSVATSAVVCAATVASARAGASAGPSPRHIAVAGLAAVGITARPLTGHFSESAFGGLAVAVHTLAAALWCGALVALVLTVQHRGQWSRVLPRFSQLALGCVLLLLVSGILGSAVRVSSAAELYATGYGRLLLAKVAVTAVLVVLGWRNRTVWLPAARSHRTTAVVSRSRALVESAVMVVAVALAAGLAVTD